MKPQPYTVVLADGDYPTAPQPLEVLERASYVACCDGAANAYIAHGRVPDVIVGDGDSLSPANRERYAHLLHRIAEQETNDLTKTINFLRERRPGPVCILGATGKREDHTLGNISLLVDYLRQGVRVEMLTDYGVFTPCCGEHSFDSVPGQQVSIFSFGATGLQAEGLRYPLRDFSSWWQGTLNEAEAGCFTIHAEGCYLVYRAY